MTTEGWDPWFLEDTELRPRYNRGNLPKGQVEHIQCRTNALHVRRIDEIVASRVEPVFKTRSDVLQDAISMWLDDWDQRYPDGIGMGGELAYRSMLDKAERMDEEREGFVQSAQTRLERLQNNKDTEGIEGFLRMMLAAQVKLQKEKAPAVYLDRIEEMIVRSRRLLAAAQ